MSEAEVLNDLLRAKAAFQLRALVTVMGLPIRVDPDMPNDLVRVVDPITGKQTDYIFGD